MEVPIMGIIIIIIIIYIIIIIIIIYIPPIVTTIIINLVLEWAKPPMQITISHLYALVTTTIKTRQSKTLHL